VLIPGAIKTKKSQCAESKRNQNVLTLKKPPKLGEANVLLSQFNGQTVPQPWSGDPNTSIAEP